MTTNGNKTVLTILIIILSFFVYGVFIYLKTSGGQFIQWYTGILFSLLPAILINFLWNKKSI